MTTQPKTKKKKKRPGAIPTLKVDKTKKPATIEDILENMFQGNFEKTKLALYILKKAKKGFPADDWLVILLEFLEKYAKKYNRALDAKKIHDLKERYIYELETQNKTRLNQRVIREYDEEIAEPAGEIKMSTWRTHYADILRKFRKAGLLYRKNDEYKISKEFRNWLKMAVEAVDNFLLAYEDEIEL